MTPTSQVTSLQRLTCFALISPLETGMRALAAGAMGEAVIGDGTLEKFLPADRIEKAQLRRAKDGLRKAVTLAGVLDYLDYAEAYELLRTLAPSLEPSTIQALEVMKNQHERIIAIRNRVAHSRPMEPDDTAVLVDVASAISNADEQNWPDLRAALNQISSNPSSVLDLSIKLPKDERSEPLHNLPVPDFDETGFLGRAAELRILKKRLLGPYPAISLLGNGGVGKTAMALKVAYDIIEDDPERFDAIVWVTAKATMLTPNEIKRVSGAIETSLGLFAAAVEQLGAPSGDPVEELYEYLATFKVLLILDNLETVLDEALRNFLLDLPNGSKVLLTSRIALGVENQVPVGPMSISESTRLMRLLGMARGVESIKVMPNADLEGYASKMQGHPAHVKWFVSSIQAGSRPEALIVDDKLVLDFCMSNVYEYLGANARVVLECMQTLPGNRNQAELAHLSKLNATEIQQAILELMTTSFLSLQHTSGQTLETSYALTEFAAKYLKEHHPVPRSTRSEIMNRSTELRTLGSLIANESAQDPLSPTAIQVRNSGDFSVAKILREALSSENHELALARCKDAQVLAPGYYEPWRVQAEIHARAEEVDLALEAYERARDFAPHSAVLAFHYGRYLLDKVGSAAEALPLLQESARELPDNYQLLMDIAWAHRILNETEDAVSACEQALLVTVDSSQEATHARTVMLIAVAASLGRANSRDISAQLEAIERVREILDVSPQFSYAEAPGDWLMFVASELEKLAQVATNQANTAEREFLAAKASEAARGIQAQMKVYGDAHRTLGAVTGCHPEKGYAFLAPTQHFLHVGELEDPSLWDWVVEGVTCAFTGSNSSRGPRALVVRPLLL